MTTPRLLIIALCLSALAIAAVACGDDDDDDRLTDVEYFAAVDEANQDLSQALEEEIFNAESAKASLEAFAAGAQSVQDGISDLTPPEDLQEVHDEYLAGVDEAVDFLETAAEETPEDAPILDLETILFADGNPFAAVEAAECELAGIAEEREITLEFLTCDEGEGEEGGDPGANPVAVEGTEFEFSFEDGAFTAETTGVVFTNAGEQPHEVIVGILEGDTTLEELIEAAVTEEEFAGGTIIAGGGAGPGGEGTLAFEAPLEPGRYVMVCFVPDEESGQLHAELGMAAEFTVE